jgi:uncharacterized membrane protein YedE/YeeE
MNTITDFTPWSSLAGGALIGLGASTLLIGSGRIAGISGIAGNLVFGKAGDRLWRALFLLGLVGMGALFSVVHPTALAPSPRSLSGVGLAGLLVGFGTRLGGGCTSGHAVCGVSRMSPRSLLATLTFMVTGAVTVALVRAFGGAS